MDRRIIVIAGPTAVGKTALSIEIARRINGEIVSADSMQIYKGLDVGTAKPTSEEQRAVKHHMIDVCSPEVRYNVADYVSEASTCIEDIFLRGKVPVVTGGTGLYIDNLIYDNDFGDFELDLSVRERLNERGEKEGGESLLKELSEIDPETAQRLHQNDIRRIVRALEVFYSTGKTQSYFIKNSRTKAPRYSFCYNVLACSDRALLYERINSRVDVMLENGLMDEVKKVLSSPWYENSTAAQAIGYKEFEEYFKGTKSLEECVELLKQRSRNYAKRQLTWFRNKKEAVFYNVDVQDNIAESIIDSYSKGE